MAQVQRGQIAEGKSLSASPVEKRDILLVNASTRKLKEAREEETTIKWETKMEGKKTERDQFLLLKKIRSEGSQNQSTKRRRENIHHPAQAHHHPLMILPRLLQTIEEIPTGTSPREKKEVTVEAGMRGERSMRRETRNTEEDTTDP